MGVHKHRRGWLRKGRGITTRRNHKGVQGADKRRPDTWQGGNGHVQSSARTRAGHSWAWAGRERKRTACARTMTWRARAEDKAGTGKGATRPGMSRHRADKWRTGACTCDARKRDAMRMHKWTDQANDRAGQDNASMRRTCEEVRGNGNREGAVKGNAPQKGQEQLMQWQCNEEQGKIRQGQCKSRAGHAHIMGTGRPRQAHDMGNGQAMRQRIEQKAAKASPRKGRQGKAHYRTLGKGQHDLGRQPQTQTQGRQGGAGNDMGATYYGRLMQGERAMTWRAKEHLTVHMAGDRGKDMPWSDRLTRKVAWKGTAMTCTGQARTLIWLPSQTHDRTTQGGGRKANLKCKGRAG